MRSNKLSSDDLIRKIEEYRLEKPGEKLSAASLGRYLRSKGYDIEDYTIRRRPGVMEYIDARIAEDTEIHVKNVAVYHALDIDAFLDMNKTRSQLKKALAERDQYYAFQSSSASAAFRENKNLHQQIRDLQEKNDELLVRLEKKCIKNNKAALRKKDEIIRKMKSIMDEYISEQMANKILEKEGILDVVSIISDKAFSNHLVSADTDIKKFKNESISKLMEDLDG